MSEVGRGQRVSRTVRVSIIIPFLNAAKFFQESVDSVFSQSFQDWELLLVDDGSSDDSTAFARHLAGQYPARVRYLEHGGHRNWGLSATRNLGIRNAQGEYVALLDADDVWVPRKLEQQLAIFDSQPAIALVYGADLWWYSWTNDPADLNRDVVSPVGILSGSVSPPTLLSHILQYKARTASPSNLIVRRDVVEKVGGFEEQFVGCYSMFEDQAFLAKVYLRFPVFVADQCWIQYRRHPDSIVSRYTQAGQKEVAALYYHTWLLRYMNQLGITEPEIRQGIQQRIWRYRHPSLSRIMGKLRGAVAQMKTVARKL